MNMRPTTNDDEGQQQVDDGADAKARRMGWKPKDEYTGNPEKWVPAEEFLKTGFDTPAILAERYKILDDRFARSERERAASAASVSRSRATCASRTMDPSAPRTPARRTT